MPCKRNAPVRRRSTSSDRRFLVRRRDVKKPIERGHAEMVFAKGMEPHRRCDFTLNREMPGAHHTEESRISLSFLPGSAPAQPPRGLRNANGRRTLDSFRRMWYNQGGRSKAPGSPYWCVGQRLVALPLALFLCLYLAFADNLCRFGGRFNRLGDVFQILIEFCAGHLVHVLLSFQGLVCPALHEKGIPKKGILEAKSLMDTPSS